jgi:LAO/AO transport system kinase
VTSKRVEEWCAAVRAGDRRSVAKAITLLESTRPEDAALGQAVLEALVPETGRSIRLGVTGPPGVGKSTLIEALGLHLVERGERVAVLAVDPSSPVSGGSILGDKTRMERLAQADSAFIRPSPSGGSLGGVAHRTREALLLCEAAGYGVVIVETVGVGQSEIGVRSMVDFFAVLLQPGAGDGLQGMKRGVLELADALVVTKADGDQRRLAERTRTEHAQALSLFRPTSAAWTPRVAALSAVTGEGVPELWQLVVEHHRALEASGELESRRRHQACAWLWSLVEEGLDAAFRGHPEVARRIPGLEADVEARRVTPAAAARALLEAFEKGR